MRKKKKGSWFRETLLSEIEDALARLMCGPSAWDMPPEFLFGPVCSVFRKCTLLWLSEGTG